MVNEGNFLESIKTELQRAIDELKKYIIIHPTNKPLVDKLNLDSRFYEVICVKLVEKDKFYITDKKGYESLFGKNYGYHYYTPHINKINDSIKEETGCDGGKSKSYIGK